MNNQSYILHLWSDYKQKFAAPHMQMLQSGQLTLNNKTMRFVYRKKGKRPPNGYILVIGLHGGGSCPPQVNEQQFKNHQSLYGNHLPDGTIWFAPRSCDDDWNMWFKDYLQDFFLQIVRAFVLNDLVDINRVFLTGYSAGGDGVYQLAPRLADHLAGAAMMAGHPNGVNLINIRNIAFSIQVGEKDDAFNRHYEGVKYIRMLNQLGHNYGGFKHQSQIHAGKPHGMDGHDGKVFSWLFNHVRNPYPNTILYKQCPGRPKPSFYYIKVGQQKSGSGDQQTVVIKQGNKFRIMSNRTISILVNRMMINQGQPVTIVHNGTITLQRPMMFKPDIAQKTFFERLDPYFTFEDEFVSDPPAPINMKTAICNQFDLDIQEKQAEYEKTLPVKIQDLPQSFNKGFNPLVKRAKNHANQKDGSEHQIMQLYNEQHNQGFPMSFQQGQQVNYVEQNLFSGQQNQPNFQKGESVQYQNTGPQKVSRQQQELQTRNPYKQIDGQKSKQPIRCADECCNIF